jgi:hypothetical protein
MIRIKFPVPMIQVTVKAMVSATLNLTVTIGLLHRFHQARAMPTASISIRAKRVGIPSFAATVVAFALSTDKTYQFPRPPDTGDLARIPHVETHSL